MEHVEVRLSGSGGQGLILGAMVLGDQSRLTQDMTLDSNHWQKVKISV